MCHISQRRGIGTTRSHQHGPEYEDDGLSSDEADGQESEASDDENKIERKSSTPDESNVFTPPRAHSSSPDLTPTRSPTAASLPPTQQGRYFLPSIPKIFTRRPVRRTGTPSDTSSSPQSHSTPHSRQSNFPTPTPGRRKQIPGPRHGQKSGGFELEADNDIVGIVMIEIHSATDLPQLRNSKLFETLTHCPLNQI
jgi:phosphatidylserine decarboxylase